MKKVLVVLAEGSEELEAVSIIDVLRRAKARLDVVSVGDLEVTCSKGLRLSCEKRIEEVIDEEYDLIAIPGGMPGAQNLSASAPFIGLLRRHLQRGGLVGAICAAPAVVLEPLRATSGKRVTCHPAFRHLLKAGTYDDSPVVVDGNLITGKGAGHAIAFALRLLETLFDPETVEEVKSGMTLL
jgi:4-methyl-5(b-hydroxyethyl)-thiazole monophosphate biosynthesis